MPVAEVENDGVPVLELERVGSVDFVLEPVRVEERVGSRVRDSDAVLVLLGVADELAVSLDVSDEEGVAVRVTEAEDDEVEEELTVLEDVDVCVLLDVRVGSEDLVLVIVEPGEPVKLPVGVDVPETDAVELTVLLGDDVGVL